MRLTGLLPLMFLFFFACAGRMFSQPVAEPYPNSHHRDITSYRVHYRLWSDDRAAPKGKVLLIHGFCGSTFSWRNNIDTLVRAGYKVLAVDLPGFGYSERSSTLNQSQSNRARMIWELIDTVDAGDTTKWNIVGHSMGGGTAEAVALVKPARVRSLTIVAGMIFIKNDDVNLGIVGLVNHPMYKRMLLDYTEHSYLSFKNFRRELKKTYGFWPDTLTTMGYWKPLQIPGTAETVVNLLANSKEVQELDAKELSRIPVLVIWGKKDRTIRLSTGKKLKRAVPTVELRVIPNVRHMTMETNPEIFNPILMEFLGRHNK